MEIKRDRYLQEIINRKDNGLIKIVTGLRRAGKSYLLFHMYYEYLLSQNIDPDHIIRFAFDSDDDVDLLDPFLSEEPTKIRQKRGFTVNSRKFRAYIKSITSENDHYYVLLDEVQLLDSFVGVLNGMLRKGNLDVYVTGSNSRLLSSDIITEFRGRGDQIRVYPLSFKEYYSCVSMPFHKALREYQYFGGMPLLMNMTSESQKTAYLKNLFEEVYIKDIQERYGIIDSELFGKLIDILSSSIGSYTTPTKLERTFRSELHLTYSHTTIRKHIDCLIDCYLLEEVRRYDVKGKKYISANSKFYFKDIGLRNARINFRQNEPTHVMENIIYNELICRGYNVDVGLVEINEKNGNGNTVRKDLEVDFVVNTATGRYYIQSAYLLTDENKMNQEEKSLLHTGDHFKKIIIVNDDIKPYKTESGTSVISLEDFLLSYEDLDSIR